MEKKGHQEIKENTSITPLPTHPTHPMIRADIIITAKTKTLREITVGKKREIKKKKENKRKDFSENGS